MAFITRYNWSSPKGEHNDGFKVVETRGYLSAKDMVEGMISAGIALREYRLNDGDINNEDIDTKLDDTVVVGLDSDNPSEILDTLTDSLESGQLDLFEDNSNKVKKEQKEEIVPKEE